MVVHHDEQSLVKITCAHCKDTRLVAVAIATETEPETPVIDIRDEPADDLGPAVTTDEVLDARLTLAGWDGDLNKLLR